MTRVLAILLALMLPFACCAAEEAAPIASPADFAAACALQDESFVTEAAPAGIVLDDAAFGTLITEGSGVVFIADAADPICRYLTPTLFDVMLKNNLVLQMYLPDDAADCEGLMPRIIDGGIAVTGSKALAEQLAQSGEIPTGAVLFVKEGKIVALHMGTLTDRTESIPAPTGEETAIIADMLQFQLDKLLSGACDVGC